MNHVVVDGLASWSGDCNHKRESLGLLRLVVSMQQFNREPPVIGVDAAFQGSAIVLYRTPFETELDRVLLVAVAVEEGSGGTSRWY